MNNWFVKTKTGKAYPCATKEQAMELAKAKSSKKRIFVVYENDKSIAAFVNKKQIPETTTLGTWVVKGKTVKEKKELFANAAQSGFAGVVCEDPCMYILQKTDDRVRIKIRTKCLILTKKLKHVCQFKSYSFTFTKNGRVFYHDGKLSFDVGDHWNIPEHAMAMLCYQIGKLRPELAPAMKVIVDKKKNPSMDILTDICVRPVKYFAFDSYKKTATPREYSHTLDYMFEKLPRGIVEETKLVEILAKECNVPCSKQLKKLYMIDLRNIVGVKKLLDCGITDINYIVRLGDLSRALLREGWCVCEFVRNMFEVRKAQSAMHLFENNHTDRTIIEDCSRMYDRVDNETLKYIMTNAKNLNEIHDTLVEQMRKLGRRRNITFKYDNSKIIRFNRSYGNIKFELAVDSRDLAVVGASMGICVGSYDSYVAEGCTTIVKMTQNDKYIACIEIHRDAVVQLKAKFNNPVKAQYKDVIDRWMNDANLYPETTDYCDIGKPWERNYSFAAIDPRAYDERPVELHIVKDRTLPEPVKTWFGLAEYENKLAFEEFNRKSKEDEEAWYAEVAARYAIA